MKINKSVAKRFKVTKKGKILFRGSHVRHLRRKKKKSQIRRQKVPQKIEGRLKFKIKKLLGKT
jgi:large subunit ribosomal protein L35